MSWVPIAVIAILLLAFFGLTRRNKQRMVMAQDKQREAITFGTEVMTTSGLYGTVVGMNPDETVLLAIAPGVEVKWALAALRDVESLPPRYQQGFGDRPGESGESGAAPDADPET